MKIVEPNFSKNQNYLFRIHEIFALPKRKGKYISLTKQVKKNGKYLKFWERKAPGRALACLLAWYWQRNFLCEFTENCFAVFDQSSRVILLTWYCRLYFFPWIPRGDPLNGSVKDFLSYCRGVNIIQFCSISVSFSSMYFFYFKA